MADGSDAELVECYGSPIRTPNIDRLAAGGVRYDNMQPGRHLGDRGHVVWNGGCGP